MTAVFQSDIAMIHAESRKRIDSLKDQLVISQKTSRGRMKAVIALALFFGTTLFTIIFALVIDKFYPEI